MVRHNIISGRDLSEDTILYRILTLPTLLILLECNRLDLRRICEWEDPGEVWVKHWFGKEDWTTVLDENGLTKAEAYNFYGLCLTRLKDSDALWRIYSPDKQSVCIATTVGRIKKLLETQQQSIEGCIGNVIYNPKVLDNHLLSQLFTGEVYSKEIKELGKFAQALIKRESFQHEAETRLIICDEKHSNIDEVSRKQKSFLSIKVEDVGMLISEMIVDPRAEEWYYQLIKAIGEKSGITVTRSQLYTPEYDRFNVSVDVKVKTRKL